MRVTLLQRRFFFITSSISLFSRGAPQFVRAQQLTAPNRLSVYGDDSTRKRRPFLSLALQRLRGMRGERGRDAVVKRSR